ncbi:helix-turn-helix domain-containing protein [Streptomyces viridodiastaticus]|nr:helix-turn-helix domain-containing protein [Streptomyces viridodiastaticus]MCX4568742.1 helix-turn-helix domain-containing protein [Streptomyces viridodiastaticus]
MTRSPALPLPPPTERRRLREACSLTRAQLAKRLGVRPDTVRAWESGRSTPRGRNRAAYAELLSTLAADHPAPRQAPQTPGGVTIHTAPIEGADDSNQGVAPDPASFVLTPTSLLSPVADTPSEPRTSSATERTTERGPTPESDSVSGNGPKTESGPASEEDPVPGDGRESEHGSVPEQGPVPVRGPEPGAGSERGAPSSGGAESGRGRSSRTGGRGRRRPSWARALRPSGLNRAPGAVPAARQAGPYLTPAQAFDALYAYCAPALVRQAYLLTGRRDLAHESVERAFQRAWDHWPEVARDPDPAGWVRAAAHDWALSPWHRLRRRYRHPEPPPPDDHDRALLDALLSLPPPYRRTLVLYDGVGLDLPDTAAETEASTRAAAGRLLYAREVLAERLPEPAGPGELHDRLAELASSGRTRAAEPAAVRVGGERRARLWTRTAAAVTVVLIGSTAMTLHTAPTHYVPPVPPGETVRGVPPRAAPGPLSDDQRELRDRLREALLDGPERLTPEAR